jgi:hypothetical protein
MRIAAGYAFAAAAMLRVAAASPDPRDRRTAIDGALVKIRSASLYFWGRRAEQCDHIATCLEATGAGSAASGLDCYAGVLEELCTDRVRSFL